MEVEDRELIDRVLAGQTEEFRVLVNRYQQPVFRFVHGLLNHHEDACDVVQDVFLAAFTKLSTYSQARGTFSTWLYTIARNRSLNELKKKGPTPYDALAMFPDSATIDEFSRREFAQELDRALAELPMEQRAAFMLVEIEQLSYAEAANIESTSLGTIKSRIHRAKRRLRTLLAPLVKEVR